MKVFEPLVIDGFILRRKEKGVKEDPNSLHVLRLPAILAGRARSIGPLQAR